MRNSKLRANIKMVTDDHGQPHRFNLVKAASRGTAANRIVESRNPEFGKV